MRVPRSPPRELFAISPVALLHVQGETVVASNEAAQALFASPNALEGLELAELLGEDHDVSGRVRAIRRDGTEVLVEVEFAPLGGTEHVLFVRPISGGTNSLVARLAEITRRVQSVRSVEALLTAVGEGMVAAGFRCGVLQLVGDQLVLQTLGTPNKLRAAAEALAERSLSGISVPLSALPTYQRVIAGGRPVYVDDFRAVSEEYFKVHSPDFNARAREVLPATDIGSGFLVPILVAGRPWGLIGMYSPFTHPEDEPTITMIAAQMGAAMELAQSIDALERRNRQLSAINALNQVTHGSLQELVGQLCRIACEGTGSDSGAVFLPDAEKGVLSLAGTHGYSQEDQVAFGRQAVESSATGRVFTTGEAKALRLSDWPESCRGLFERAQVQEMAIVPLRVQGWIIGTLNLRRREPVPFSRQDLAEAETLGAQIAVQLENARLYRETERRLQVLSALFSLSQMGTRTLDLWGVIDASLEKVEEALGVDAAVAHLVGPDGLFLASSDRGNEAARALQPILRTLPIDPSSVSGKAAFTRSLVTVSNGAWPERTCPAANSVGLQVGAAVPLLSGDRLIGTLCVAKRSERPFTTEEIQLLWSCASYLSVSVEYLRLFEDERRRVEELKRLQVELVKRERLAALGELSAVVAHEVRNPLGVIFNSLSALRKARALGAVRDSEMLLDIVGEEAERLNSIVGDLLDFARPIEPELRSENLESILTSAVEVAAGAANARADSVTVEVSPEVAAVPADGRMLRQAMINLLVNAFQATQKDGRVAVRAKLEERAGIRVARIDVLDTGPGISAELRSKIFQPFFTTKATGTGLGLAVVKRIVDAHRGEISVESPGQGTTFTIRLPVGQ